MKIVYEINRWDLFRFYQYAIVRHRLLQVFILLTAMFVWWSSFTYEGKKDAGVGFRIAVGCTSVVMLFAAVGTLVAIFNAAMAAFSRHLGMLGEHVLEITDDALRETTRVNETVVKWNGIHAVKRSKRYAYVFLNEHMAFVVPLREGRVQGDVETFLLGLQEKRERPNQSLQPTRTAAR